MRTTTLEVVVVLVVVFLPSMVVSRLAPDKGGREVLLEAGRALGSVLEASSSPYCSTILLTDGETSNTAVYKVTKEVRGAFGMGVFESPAGGEDNATLSQLAQVVSAARKFRDLCWCLTLVVASEDPAFLGAFSRAADEGRLLVWSTRVLLVTSLDLPSLRQVLASHWAFAMMNVMLLNLEDDPDDFRCGLHVHLPYSARGVGHEVRVASWTPGHGLLATTADPPLFPEKSANFYGAPLLVASNPFPPYWMESLETTPEGASVKRYSGRGWLLLESVAKKMNFTIEQLPTRDWAEVMDRIKDRSAYISPVAYVVMPHQLTTVDYSVFVEPDTLTFSMATPSLRPRWEGLYYPLRPLTWLLILLVLAALPLALLTVSRIVPQAAGGSNRPLTLQKVIQELTGTLLGQNLSGRLPSSTSVRLFLGAWLVYAFILTTAYRSNLTAFLTVPKYPPRVETLQQLIEYGARVTVPLDDGDDLITFFRQSGSRDFQLLAERTYKVQDTMTGLQQATGAREAYVYVRKLLEALIAEHFTDVDGRALLYVARENISPGFAAWPVIRDAPFKPPLDRCLTALLEAGLSEKWMSQMLDHTRRESRIKQRAKLQKALKEAEEEEGSDTDLLRNQETTSSRSQPLTVVHMQGPLFLLLLGLLLSLASFILELLTKWCFRTP